MNLENHARLIRVMLGSAVAYLFLTLSAGAFLIPLFAEEPGDIVVAKVDDSPVMRSDLERLILEYERKTHKKKVTYEEKTKLLRNLIRRHLILAQESVQALKNDKDVIKAVKKYEEGLIIARYLKDQVGSKLTVTEAELKKYYKKNRYRFSSPPKVKARHILLRTEEEAQKVLARLHKGEDFSELAKEYSIDLPMALEGGSMGTGTIEKGEALPALDKVLFTLNVGEISDIVKTRYGYHILTVDKIIPASCKPFEELRGKIRKRILREKEAKAFDEMADRVEKGANIKIFEDRLKEDVH